MRRLQNRIGKDGVLRIISQQTRSQAVNRELAVERFSESMREALRQVPIKKKKSEQGGETAPPGGKETARSSEKQTV
jgi:ribosome-associated protein